MKHSTYLLNTLNKDSVKQLDPKNSNYHYVTDLERCLVIVVLLVRALKEGNNKDFQTIRRFGPLLGSDAGSEGSLTHVLHTRSKLYTNTNTRSKLYTNTSCEDIHRTWCLQFLGPRSQVLQPPLDGSGSPESL